MNFTHKEIRLLDNLLAREVNGIKTCLDKGIDVDKEANALLSLCDKVNELNVNISDDISFYKLNFLDIDKQIDIIENNVRELDEKLLNENNINVVLFTARKYNDLGMIKGLKLAKELLMSSTEVKSNT